MDASTDNWQTFLEEQGPAMLLFARQFTRDLPTAEDVLHDAFVSFWPRRQEASDAKAYLYMTIRNTAFQHLRRSSRRDARERANAQPEGQRSLFDTAIELDERQKAIEEAMKQLPESQRLVVSLKVWSQLTFVQIGAALEISPHTAASRWRGGLQTLREALAQEAPQ